jgi:hypothetical protein
MFKECGSVLIAAIKSALVAAIKKEKRRRGREGGVRNRHRLARIEAILGAAR